MAWLFISAAIWLLASQTKWHRAYSKRARSLLASSFTKWLLFWSALAYLVFWPRSLNGVGLCVLAGCLMSLIVGALDAWSKSRYGY